MTTPDPVPPAQRITPCNLARIAEGEAGGASIWGSESAARQAQVHVMWVVMNRLRHRAYAPPYDALSDFYGAELIEQPGAETIQRALTVLHSDPKSDPTGGALFVLSEQDRKKLGVRQGDLILIGRGPFSLSFYRTWPG